MEHKHPVTDTDAHFEINTITRNISAVSGKSALIQGDHNSERFTFELSSQFVDSHDMTLCNVVQIHYINIDANTKEQSIGVYEVDDMAVADEKVTLSWLISNNATKYAGGLSFIVKFKCVNDDGSVGYVWNSGIFKGISVSNGIDNGEVIEEEYADILAQFEERIATLEQGGGNSKPAITAISVTESADGTVTMVNTLEGGGTETLVISPDANGNPSKLTYNGTEIPITWTEATSTEGTEVTA